MTAPETLQVISRLAFEYQNPDNLSLDLFPTPAVPASSMRLETMALPICPAPTKYSIHPSASDHLGKARIIK